MFLRQVCVRNLTPEDVDIMTVWGVVNLKRCQKGLREQRITFSHPGTLDNFLLLCVVLNVKAVDW